MIAKAGQIIAIDSVKVDNTLSGDGVRTPLGVKATAPAVSGHAGLSAEKVDNTVYIGMVPDAVKVVSTDETVSIHKDIEEDGTVKYNLGVSVEPVVSDTRINGGDGIKVYSGASATFTISVSGDYVKSETLNDYYLKADADATFQPKGKYVTSADASLNDKQLVLKNNKWEEVDAGTDYTAGDNIDIRNDVISGRDWTPELAQKADKSALAGLATETWVEETINDVIDDYYTSDEVDDLLDNYALSADVDTAIDESEANIAYWANNRFQLSGNYASATDITSLSSTVETNFQKKGKYITSAENPEFEGKALVLKDNQWVVAPEGTVYTPGPNIDITNNVISGHDWSPELAEKANTSDLEGLATQDDLDELNDAIAANLAETLDETSAWANETFQPKGNYLTDDALEDYYTKSEVNDKVQDLANEFDSVIDSVSATIDRDFALKSELEEKLDKSVTTNWDVKEYSAGENITIQNHKISGKDWSTEIEAKQDKLTDKQLSAISSVSAIEAMSGKWVTSGVDVIAGDYYYGLVNKNGTVEWELIPKPDYPDIVGNNGISATYDSVKNEYDIGLSATDLAYMYDTYVNNGVSVTDGTVIKFTGNNYNHITVDTDGYFVLPETANKITFNINENIDNNNPDTHDYLLNKLSLKTDKSETLVSTQNYYPTEVGSSNGTISITVDHSVDPTRKYALVYEGSDILSSANLNITMSIVEEVTCLSDNLTNSGKDYNGVTPVTVNNNTRKVQLEYDSDIFILNSNNELTLRAGSSDTPIDSIEFNKLVDSINGRMTETIPFGALNQVASLAGKKQYAYLFRPTIEYDMTQNTVAYMFGGNYDSGERVSVAVYDSTKTENNLIWRSDYPELNVGDGGEHIMQAYGSSPSGTIYPDHLYYVAVRIDKTGGGGSWNNVLGVPITNTTNVGTLRVWLGYDLNGNEDLNFPDSINFNTQGSLGNFGGLKPYVGFRTNVPNI